MDLLYRLRGSVDVLGVVLSYLDLWTAKWVVRRLVNPKDRQHFRPVLLHAATRDRVATRTLCHDDDPADREVMRELDRVLFAVRCANARSFEPIVAHGYSVVYEYLGQSSPTRCRLCPPHRVAVMTRLVTTLVRGVDAGDMRLRLCLRVVFLYLRRLTGMDLV